MINSLNKKRISIFGLILIITVFMGYTSSKHTMKNNFENEKINIIENYSTSYEIYNSVFEKAKGVIVLNSENLEMFSKLDNKIRKIGENRKIFQLVYDVQLEIYGAFYNFVEGNQGVVFAEMNNEMLMEFTKRKDEFFVLSNSYQEMLKEMEVE